MEEIKAGEYVRTKTGRIYKLGYYSKEERRWICVTDEDWFPVYESGIAKHSFNIIDLIEVGDYVNGQRVDDFVTHYGEKVQVVCNIFGDRTRYSNPQIRGVVTKEIYEEDEYKV